MKKIIASILLILSVSAVLSGCEKNDYQHPLHRK
jgi:predicted small secreted protein